MSFRYINLLLCLVFFTAGNSLNAQYLIGTVSDTRGHNISYTNVYVEGTTNGTTTNEDGQYRIAINVFPSTVVYKHLGYQTHREVILSLSETKRLNVTLAPEKYTITQVEIIADDNDPANQIMRNAIAKRKYHLQEFKEYSCDVYIKGVQRITEYPKKILGVKIDLSEIQDTATGIVYLSESVSRYNYKFPDKVNEEMISSKVSGSNKAFSFNQASGMDLSFYNSLIDFGDISPRGFVSPLASNAFFYYKFSQVTTYQENGITINKVKVTPKRKHDPVFRGHIYIQDSTWRIHGAGLWITKDSQIEIVDSMFINQVYIPVNKEGTIWNRGSIAFHFGFSFMKFKGGGDFVAVYSNYNTTPAFEKKLFRGGEVMKVRKDSNKRDSIYWENIRPVPLTKIEQNDYVKRDSIITIKESKTYLDSIDAKSNKFQLSNILTGYTFNDRYNKSTYSFSSLLNSIQFNTVEGFSLALTVEKTKELKNKKSYEVYLSARYGFSNRRLNGIGGLNYTYSKKKFASIGVELGSDLVQFNEQKPIASMINSLYSLFDGKNYMKLYKKDYLTISSSRELINGLTGGINITYAQREYVENTTDYSFINSGSVDYTSNVPFTGVSEPELIKNTALITDISLAFVPFQEYISRPDIKYILGSKYPEFSLNMKFANSELLGTDADFFSLSAMIKDDMDVGLLGTFSYWISGGKFIGSHTGFFADYQHFNGNQTIISSFADSRFDLLEYYKYSTNDKYFSIATSHSFGGFLLNKIPLIRKLKLNEVISARYLNAGDFDEHFEFGIGIEKLNIFRIDLVTSIKDNGDISTGIVFGIKGLFGPE